MAGQASRENGKLGGRPKGYPALEAERARLMIAEKLSTEFAPIVDKAINMAKAGNKDAREWLTDRAYGKPKTAVEVGFTNVDDETVRKAKQAIAEFAGTDNRQG